MSESMARELGFPDNSANAESATVQGKVLHEIMGDFQLMPTITNDATAATVATAAGETAMEGSEQKLGFKKAAKEVAEKPQPPLTRLEAHVLRSLTRALSDGDATLAQDMLGILADHPESIRRVLEDLKNIKEGSDDLKSLRVSWEQGTDRNNQRFVRLYMSRPDSPSSRVDVVIGSDGRHQSVRHNEKHGTTENIPLQAGMEAVRPVEALRQLSVKQELLREAIERGRPPQQPEQQPKPKFPK